jgi:hypothetical protein
MSERMKAQLTGILVLAVVLGSVGYALASSGGSPGPSSKASDTAVTAFAAASTHSQPEVSTTGSGDAVGPDASGPDLFGLCTAWEATQSHGGVNGLELGAVAFLNLTEAGGADNVASYCSGVTAGNGSANAQAPVDTPNDGGTGTADTASRGASEVGTSTAANWSGGHSGLGAANH